jgi:hypothetical protein
MTMTTAKRGSLWSSLVVAAFLFSIVPASAQNAQVTIPAQSFNAPGLFTTGTTFLGTAGMDNGNNCTPPTGYTNCPDAYSANQLGIDITATPPSLTPASLNIPFIFGPINTVDCGPAPAAAACMNDVISLPGAPGVTISIPSSQQQIYSTLVILGNAVNGAHTGTVTVTYGDGSTSNFNQTFSDWCSFGANQYESIAVGGIARINSTGTLNGASCNLYAYTYSLNVTAVVSSLTLTNTDGTPYTFALAMTLKPPTYTIDAGTANPTSISTGASSSATITVQPQPGYTGTITLSCSISPAIPTNSASVTPTCALNPTSVTIASGAPPPTSTLSFNAAAPPKSASLVRRSLSLYALCLPIPGLFLAGFGCFRSRRRKLAGLLFLALSLFSVTAISGCVTTVHLGNVGTPPGPYTVTVTGTDTNNLSQASNPAGTTNQVTVTVTAPAN